MEKTSNKKEEQKTSRNKQEKSILMIYIDLPWNSLNQIILKNPNIVNTIDNSYETLLSYAIKEKKEDICENILTSKIIDLKYQDKNGNSYLHLSVLNQLEKIVQILIQRGININKQNKNGNTAIHLAYLKNYESMIHILKNNKADLTIKNKDKKIPEELKIKPKTEYSQQGTRGRTTKANSKAKEKNSNNNSKLTANSANNNNIKPNVKSIKESNLDSKNLKINLLFNHNTKANIKKIESLPTLRDIQKTQRNDNTKIKKLTSSNFIQKTDINKKGKTKKVLKDNSSNDKNLNEENNINNKLINMDIGNNTSGETKFKSGTYKDKLSKTNNIDDKEKSEKNQIFEFNKEEDIFKFNDCEDFDKQLEFTDLNNNFKKYTFLNINKTKNYREDDEVKLKEDYERIHKKYIDAVLNNSKNNNEKDSDENNSQIKEDDEYCVRFDSESSDDEVVDKNKSSLNLMENSLILNSNNKNKNHQKTRNNNNKDLKLKSETNRDKFYFDIMDEKQFSKTLVKDLKDQKFDKYSNKSDDNNNDFENQMAYQLYPDKGQKYNNNLKDLLIDNEEKEKFSIKKKISEDLKEPLLFPELDQVPKDIQEIEDNIAKNNSLKEFLLQINMKKYINIFIENGFDDLKIIIEQAQKGIYIKDSELKEAGIVIPGDRAKILIRIQEKAGNFKFIVPKSVYYNCKHLNKINNDINIKNLRNWLKNLRVDNYLKNFINNGYHSIELLFLQMESQSPLTLEILKEEIGIDKIGHRSRIINKLKEDSRSYINKLKTSILLVGNSNNNKFCDCIIC